MKVLVTGVKGQLGYDVVNELTKRGIEAVGVDIQEMDITDAASVEKVIGEAAPDAVVHCAAYTAVDAAEDNVEIAVRSMRTAHRTLRMSARSWTARWSISVPIMCLTARAPDPGSQRTSVIR